MGNHIWRSMRNAGAVALLCTFVSVPAMAASNPATLPVTATIATLKLIPVSAAPLYANIQVQDYYGTGTGCPIQYAWNASDSRADNGGAIINPTGNAGNGRWDLNQSPTAPVHSCVFGVKVDSPAQTGTGTDNTTHMQALINWAFQYGPNHIWLDSSPNNCIKIASHLTPAQGQIMEGDGAGDPNQVTNTTTPANTGSCLNYTGVPGAGGEYAVQLQTPCSGLGTTQYASPQFKNFSINYFSSDTNPGGGIQLNTIACGFTDDASSQQPLNNPKFENLRCSLRNIANSQKICIQVSKARETIIDGVTSFGGLTAFDLEGTENSHIKSCASSFTYGSEIRLKRQGTFGNNTTVQNCQLLSLADFGQTVDSILYDDARSSLIENNLFENFSMTITLTSQLHLGGGFVAGIYDNVMTGGGANWLLVDGTYNNITAYGNGGYGVVIPTAKFLAGNYYYPTPVRSILSHQGNGISGDEGWPFNSVNGLDTILPAGVEAVYTANTSGLGPASYGTSEIPVNAIFTMPTTGTSASNYLEGIINRLPAIKGTFDLKVQAAQTSGTGQWTCQMEDNGTLVGSPIAQAITASMAWYTLAFAQAVSTSGGWRCWNTGTGTVPNPALLAQVQVVDH